MFEQDGEVVICGARVGLKGEEFFELGKDEFVIVSAGWAMVRRNLV